MSDDFMMQQDLLDGLNEAQAEAVTTTEGFIRVVAGAGSGKTRALTRRFAFLVNELGILPGNILCVTFTNKSANEMRQRIHNLTGDNDTGYINTFHGFCVSVLQEDSYAVQYPKSFLVIDNSDIDDMLGIIYEERGLTLRDMTFSNARDMIEIRKGIENPRYYLDMITMSLDTLREKYLQATEPRDIIFYGYLYQEKKCFALDYNDLIKFTLYIFSEHEDIRRKWQERLEYIMIDEFQDIDDLQYELMCVLCAWHKNLFVVGDPDQTIYTWRGANVKYLLDFDSRFPGAQTIMMMDNYRSTPQILRSVNSLISHNHMRLQKDLVPHLSDGQSVVCHFAPTAEEEAKWIARQIKDLTRDCYSEEGIPAQCPEEEPLQRPSGLLPGQEPQQPSDQLPGQLPVTGHPRVKRKDITILYRAHYVTRSVEDILIREKIPYTIYSGVRFYDRMEIKDALSYLRMIAMKDDLSFRRVVNVPKRNMGNRRMEFLTAYADEHGCSLYEALRNTLDNEIFKGTKASGFVDLIESFSRSYAGQQISEVLAALLNKSGYEIMLRTEGAQERLDNLAELKQSVHEYETTCGEEVTLEDYLRHVAFFTNRDTDESGDTVRLMTVHTAKGLEFPYVFLCGMNEGIFPSRKINTEAGMEEERRLCYVAMTRAMKRLYLSEAGGRNFDGAVRYPSRFLLDIDPQLLEFTAEPEEGLIRQTKEYISYQKAFYKDSSERLSIGTKVIHKVFGAGTITDIDDTSGAYVIQFEKTQTPRKISFRAKLEITNN